MRGLMMDRPLLISSLIDHAAAAFPDQEIVSRTVEGRLHRQTYGQLQRRCKQLANALAALGVEDGDRVGTIAWNVYRHLELYFGISGIGAVCHTLNPRLHPSQLVYIINHAKDRFLFIDLTFIPLLQSVAHELKALEGVVIMTDREHMPETALENVLCYEDLVLSHSDQLEWPEFDERSASSLCYTSGTTGNPKGVLYSHRSTVLHSWAIALPDAADLGLATCLLPVVPMFHVNAWALPYAAAMTGTKLVLPGPALDGESLTTLMSAEEVTVTAGVPTVWLGLLHHWQETGKNVPSLRRVLVGGSAPPRTMIESFEKEFGIEFRHAWGMTEMSPLGTVNVLAPSMRSMADDERFAVKCKQGRPVFGVELKIVDEEDRPLPHDGKTFGEVKVRGPWVCSAYYRERRSASHDEDGWFATGDIATVDGGAMMHITDRKKDLVKSGGEWISSIELENLAASHPDVAHAAVIGVPDAKWSERPLLVVVPKKKRSPTKQEILDYFKGKVADWWIPNDVVFETELPLGGTGKVQKARLRELYAQHGAQQR
jgi:fatty-acyl-CoA synthase